MRNGRSMGSAGVGEGSTVNVPSVVGVGFAGNGPVLAFVGMAVTRRTTTRGMGGGIGVEVGGSAIRIGVAGAPPHPLKSDITKVITIPHFTI